MLSRMIKTCHRWTRLSSVHWEDAWAERLRFLGPERVAFITWPDSRALKIEAYCSEQMARRLVKEFGGRTAKISPQVWTGDPARPRAPLAIRGKLKVFSDKAGWREWQNRQPPGIFIPAGMAFGTGEHATTATCLRMLSDLIPQVPENFRVLDLGTGSGILAVAAEAFGAGRVDAMDYDATAVRIARENAKTNGCRHVHVSRGDVLKLAVRQPYDIVLANLFSDVLIAAAPRIAKSVKCRGWLVFSGILSRQAREVKAAWKRAGFSGFRIVTRGKWCAGLCRKS